MAAKNRKVRVYIYRSVYNRNCQRRKKGRWALGSFEGWRSRYWQHSGAVMDALEADACKIKLPNKYIDHTNRVIFGHVVVQMLRE